VCFDHYVIPSKKLRARCQKFHIILYAPFGSRLYENFPELSGKFLNCAWTYSNVQYVLQNYIHIIFRKNTLQRALLLYNECYSITSLVLKIHKVVLNLISMDFVSPGPAEEIFPIQLGPQSLNKQIQINLHFTFRVLCRSTYLKENPFKLLCFVIEK
jgi:hypothetical protein